jgi:hypothetical protein
MVQSFHLSAYGLQLALDASEVFFAGPVRFGPDVAHGFPDMSAFWLALLMDMQERERGVPDVNDLQSVLYFLWQVFHTARRVSKRFREGESV